ncbi:MAG: hypothetical protein DSY57_05640, partial [Desulfobulbus sp.]
LMTFDFYCNPAWLDGTIMTPLCWYENRCIKLYRLPAERCNKKKQNHKDVIPSMLRAVTRMRRTAWRSKTGMTIAAGIN